MLLSIIVSVYNIEYFLADCLKSLVQIQLSSDKFEIIVIDDGSTDGSLSIIKEYAYKYPFLHYYRQENKGVGSTRNMGILLARGTYLWFVDGDDFIDSKKVKNCLAEAESRDLDVLAFDYTPVNEKGEPHSWVSFKLNFPKSEAITGAEFYFRNFAKSYIWLYFFKRELFTHHKLAFHDDIRMQDGEIMPRIFMHSLRVKYIEEKLIFYRYRSNSALNNKSQEARSYFYYSMVIVADRLRTLHHTFKKNELMYKALTLKRNQLNQMLFTNLVSNNYSKNSNIYYISLLKDYKLFPFRRISGFTLKMNLAYNLVRRVVNISPSVGRFLYQKIFFKK